MGRWDGEGGGDGEGYGVCEGGLWGEGGGVGGVWLSVGEWDRVRSAFRLGLV